VRPLYRVLLALGLAGLLILLLGAAEFAHFEPLNQKTGTSARVSGVFQYDPRSGHTLGSDRSRFRRDELFAARVDWSTLPPDMQVGARWYNGFGDRVGSVGPAPAGELTQHEVVPVAVPPGLNRNLPGHYLFVVERYRANLPVEVLARRIVLVERNT
jgi:hypothetical protein